MTLLKERRLALGLTQQALADAVGVPQPTISKLELGIVEKPSFELAVRVARVLKVKPEALFPIEAVEK